MACGLPCVVSNVPSLMEWIKDGENGFVVPCNDNEVLAERIIELLKDDGLAEKFGNVNAQIAKKKADWDKNFEKLGGIYKRLIAS